MLGFGQAERGAAPAFKAAEDEFLLLFLARRELFEHFDEGEIADDAVFVLQIIVQPQPLGGEMFADHRHPQIAAALAAIFLRR